MESIMGKSATVEVVLILIMVAKVYGDMESHIVGGGYASIQQYPHSVLLEVKEDGGSVTCGASVLSQMFLLTAGHCLNEYNDEKFFKNAFAGHEDIYKMKYMRQVKRFIIHAGYNDVTFTNDIAVVRLAKALILGPTVKRVIIDTSFSGTRDATVAGWGMVNDERQEFTSKLKSVKQTIQDVNVCNKIYKKINGPFITAGVLCAQNNVKNRPSRGDSGSALMSSPTTQIGLVSFRWPSIKDIIVYTNVTYHLQWLRDKTKKLYCNRKKFN